MNPMLALSRQSGKIAETLTVQGLNMKPGRSGLLYWVNAIEEKFPLGTFATDSSGAFQKGVIVPPSARGLRQTVRAVLIWEEGDWKVSDTLSLTFEKMVETVFLALIAATFGGIVALPLSFLCARNLMTGNKLNPFIYYAVRTSLNILRSIEPLIMAILLVILVGIGPFDALRDLGLHPIADFGKLFSEQIKCIDTGSVEAINVVGVKPLQVFFLVCYRR